MLCFALFMGNILHCFQAICCERYSAPAVAQLIQYAITKPFPLDKFRHTWCFILKEESSSALFPNFKNSTLRSLPTAAIL